jgi:deazaflavin-dependent oxidoreductase (nitroreductase family)
VVPAAALRAIGALNTWVYRLSGGKIMGRMPTGAPICLLTTTGRKSGQRRTVPLLYLADGDDFIVVGSQGGAPRHPGWFLNLEANPQAEVELGRRRVPVTARRLSDEERDRFWPRLVAIYPPYEEYRRRTARSIPVLRLSPRAPD